MGWIDRFVALLIAGLTAYMVAQPLLRGAEGPAYDLLLRARHEVYGQYARQDPPPVVVVGLDRETALRPPFDRLPQELWTPQIAAVMQQVLDAGALVVAQHQAFTTSANEIIAGYDDDYTGLLGRAGAEGRLVLGRRPPAADILGPAPEHVDAVGGDRNLRRVGVLADDDDVVRHVRLYESSRDQTGALSLRPTLALELAARVVGDRPQLLNGAPLQLGRYAVPGSESNTMRLNFQGGNGGVPVFSLADLYACAIDGDEAFFRKYFDNKVVLFGFTDTTRSRRATAARFLGQHNVDRAAARCRLPQMESLIRIDSSHTLPEVLVTATAVRNLLLGEAVKSLPDMAAVAVSGLLALAMALAVLRISPLAAAPAALIFLAGWGYIAVVMLARETWLMPLAQPALALLLAFVLASAYRGLRHRHPRTA